jgi:hypothetical protein
MDLHRLQECHRAGFLEGVVATRQHLLLVGVGHRQQVVEADVPRVPDAGAAFLSGIGFPRGGLALPAGFDEAAVDPGFFKLQLYECSLPSPEIGLAALPRGGGGEPCSLPLPEG